MTSRHQNLLISLSLVIISWEKKKKKKTSQYYSVQKRNGGGQLLLSYIHLLGANVSSFRHSPIEICQCAALSRDWNDYTQFYIDLNWVPFSIFTKIKGKEKERKKRRNRFHSLRWVDPDWPFMKWCATISYYQRYYIPWPSIRPIEEKPEWWKQMTVKNLTRIAKGQQKRIDESQRGRWISECDGVLQGTCLMVFYLSFRLLYSFLHKRTKWT